jgi:hypothetical protein
VRPTFRPIPQALNDGAAASRDLGRGAFELLEIVLLVRRREHARSKPTPATQELPHTDFLLRCQARCF